MGDSRRRGYYPTRQEKAGLRALDHLFVKIRIRRGPCNVRWDSGVVARKRIIHVTMPAALGSAGFRG